MNPRLRRLRLKLWYLDYAIPALLFIPLTIILLTFKLLLLLKVTSLFGGVLGFVADKLSPVRVLTYVELHEKGVTIYYRYLRMGKFSQEILHEDYTCFDILDNNEFRQDKMNIFRVHLVDGYRLNFKFDDYATRQGINNTLMQAGFTQKKFYAPDLIEYTPPKLG